jgi:O-antigen/teichoic acid export membrane protein
MDSVSNLIFYNIIGSIIELIFVFLFLLLSRILYPIEIIGVITAIQSELMFFIFIGSLGINTAHIKFISEFEGEEEKKKKYNSVFLIIKIGQFLLYFIIIYITYFEKIIYSEYSHVYFICLISIFFESMLTFGITPVLLSKKKIVGLKISSILKSFIKVLLLIVLFTFNKTDIITFALIHLSGPLFAMLTSLLFVKDFKLKRPDRQIFGKYIKYSFPFMFSTTSRIIFDNFSIITINNLGNFQDVANFSTAFKLYSFISIIPVLFGQVLLTTFSRNDSKYTQKQKNKIINKSHKFISFIFVYVLILSIYFSDYIIQTIFGVEYSESSAVLNILLIERIFLGYTYIYYVDLQARGKVFFSEIMPIIKLIVFITLNNTIVSTFYNKIGIKGLAISIVISSFVFTTIFNYIACKKYQYQFYWEIFKQLIIIPITLLPMLPFKFLFDPSLIVMICEFLFISLLYLGLSYLFKIITKDDILMIKFYINPNNLLKNLIYQSKK